MNPGGVFQGGMAGPQQTGAAAGGGQQSVGQPAGSLQQPQAGDAPPMNPLSLCRVGVEAVQEVLNRTIEMHQLLKAAQLPGAASPQSPPDQVARLKELVAKVRQLFKRLAIIYHRVSDDTQALDLTPVESLVQYEDEAEARQPLAAPPEAARRIKEETALVKAQLAAASQRQRQTMEQLRQIMWDINTMLAARAP